MPADEGSEGGSRRPRILAFGRSLFAGRPTGYDALIARWKSSGRTARHGPTAFLDGIAAVDARPRGPPGARRRGPSPTPSPMAFVVGTRRMKVQLIVVQGKPEGKTIPLLTPRFKIGRGETCHLRPNSEQVSREHAEFVVGAEAVTVTDLGSRNGTLVNGKAITDAHTLKDRDLVQVGPLTFAVSIEGAPQPRASIPAAPAGRREGARSRRQQRRDRLLADRRQGEGRPREPLGRLRRRHDHHLRLQGRRQTAPARGQARARGRGRTTRNTNGSRREATRKAARTRDEDECGRDARGVHRRVEPVLRQEEEGRGGGGEAGQAGVREHERRRLARSSAR